VPPVQAAEGAQALHKPLGGLSRVPGEIHVEQRLSAGAGREGGAAQRQPAVLGREVRVLAQPGNGPVALVLGGPGSHPAPCSSTR
jgi:hypothetical protein